MDAQQHRKVRDAIDDRLTRVNAVYARVAGQKFELSVLTFCHAILSAIPDAAFIELQVSDQGGDDMTWRHVGVPQEAYDAWTGDRSYVAVASPTQPGYVTADTEFIDGVNYVCMDETYDVFHTVLEDGTKPLTEDDVMEYAMALEDYELSGQLFWEPTGNRHSGTGRLWIAKALDALSQTYEGFVGEALDPFPDPTDTVAVAAWLARETAPKEKSA